jgi:pimeloyl-ACP methyl ester carboxylesterase
VVNGCAGAGEGWRVVPDVGLAAAELGTGPTVVFANDSSNSVCAWLPIARALAAGEHVRVVLFTYYDFSEQRSVDDMLALARKVSRTSHYALVGASLGGRLVIECAAQHPAGLAAIVSLSGERMIQPGYPDILPQARRVITPALYIGSSEDPLADGSRQPTDLHRAMRGSPNELLQLVGFDHGTDLLELPTSDGHTVSDRIADFLRSQLA